MDQGFQRHAGAVRRPVAIVLSRLPAVDRLPGLICFSIETGAARPTSRRGMLTDAALRSRLAFFDAHSANEIAAIRKALSADNGSTTVYEDWPELEGCVRFWYGFAGSKIRPIESACESCGKQDRDSVGGSIGESFLRRCECGRISRITVSNPLPVAASPLAIQKIRGTVRPPDNPAGSPDSQ